MAQALDPNLVKHVRELDENAPGSLQPITPEEAITRFLENKSTDIRPNTIAEYRRKLTHFERFCDTLQIENLNDLDGCQLQEYRQWRHTESTDQTTPLSNKTLRDDIYLLRDFFRFLGQIEGVPAGFHEKVNVPELGETDGVRDVRLDSDRLRSILEYFKKYEYATRTHVIWAFHAHTGRRPGCLHSLDLEDLHLDRDHPYVEFHHRPEETSLKNGVKGEGQISISDDVAQVFRDYIDNNRIEVTTESGRSPFITSNHGRLSKSTMRKHVYKWSRPCTLSGECPHDRDIDTCEAAQRDDAASRCPSSRPPYALRHGYLTQKRQEGVPDRTLSERCDVSREIIEKHYDERTDEEKRALRQRILDKTREESSGGGYL